MSQSNEPGAHPTATSAPTSAPPAAARDTGERHIEHRDEPHHPWRARAEQTLERDTEKAWRALRKRPSVGVILVGGLAVLAADAVGVGELAMGLAVGYVAYRLLRKDHQAIVSPPGAVEHPRRG